MKIKFTGFLDVADVDMDDLDTEHSTGLSDQGFRNLVSGENGRPLKLTDLDDVETEVVA